MADKTVTLSGGRWLFTLAPPLEFPLHTPSLKLCDGSVPVAESVIDHCVFFKFWVFSFLFWDKIFFRRQSGSSSEHWTLFVSLSYRGGRQDWVTHFEVVTSSFLVSGLCVVLLLPGERKKKAAVEAMCAGWGPSFFVAMHFSFLAVGHDGADASRFVLAFQQSWLLASACTSAQLSSAQRAGVFY